MKAAVEYTVEKGASVVEGHRVKSGKSSMPAVFAYTGPASAFGRAGFEEVLRRSETRPIIRYIL